MTAPKKAPAKKAPARKRAAKKKTPDEFQPEPMLIGLSGLKRAGKDTVGCLIERAISGPVVRIAFADRLKAMAIGVDPYVYVRNPLWYQSVRIPEWSFERLSDVVNREGWELAKEHADVRRLLQRLGTEGVRENLGADAWVNATAPAISTALQAGATVVVTDVRFSNEIGLIHRMGGSHWVIERPERFRGERDMHRSEQEWQDHEPDLTIVNDGTIDDLAKDVRDALYVVAQGRH